MHPKHEKLKILEQILDSKYFSGSPSSTALLKFLFDSTIKNIDVKESVIGLHIFGDRYDGEKSNARIRVSVYHLRKKLDQYYEDEGSSDAIRLTIEKGQYRVTFIEDKSKHKLIEKPNLRLHLAYISILLLLLLSYVLIHRKPNMYIWNSIFSNNRETVLYIGDVFGYLAKTPTGGFGWQRDYEINSEKDLKESKRKLSLSNKEIKDAGYSYVTASEVDAVKKISELFYWQKKDFTVRLSSKLDMKNIKEQNIIYVGPIKNNNHFIQQFVDQYAQIQLKDNIIYKSEGNQSITLWEYYTEKNDNDVSSEIAIVSKQKGGNNTNQIFFFSDHDIGVRASVDYFTNIDSLKRFQNSYLKDKDDFTAIFLVKGKDRIDLSMKLLDVF